MESPPPQPAHPIFSPSPFEGSPAPPRTFEVLLSQEQFRQLQKLLPQGYSLGLANKGTRPAFKKAISKDSFREDYLQNQSNADRQKRKAYREAEQTIKGTNEFVKRAHANHARYGKT